MNGIVDTVKNHQEVAPQDFECHDRRTELKSHFTIITGLYAEASHEQISDLDSFFRKRLGSIQNTVDDDGLAPAAEDEAAGVPTKESQPEAQGSIAEESAVVTAGSSVVTTGLHTTEIKLPETRTFEYRILHLLVVQDFRRTFRVYVSDWAFNAGLQDFMNQYLSDSEKRKILLSQLGYSELGGIGGMASKNHVLAVGSLASELASKDGIVLAPRTPEEVQVHAIAQSVLDIVVNRRRSFAKTWEEDFGPDSNEEHHYRVVFGLFIEASHQHLSGQGSYFAELIRNNVLPEKESAESMTQTPQLTPQLSKPTPRGSETDQMRKSKVADVSLGKGGNVVKVPGEVQAGPYAARAKPSAVMASSDTVKAGFGATTKAAEVLLDATTGGPGNPHRGFSAFHDSLRTAKPDLGSMTPAVGTEDSGSGALGSSSGIVKPGSIQHNAIDISSDDDSSSDDKDSVQQPVEGSHNKDIQQPVEEAPGNDAAGFAHIDDFGDDDVQVQSLQDSSDDNTAGSARIGYQESDRDVTGDNQTKVNRPLKRRRLSPSGDSSDDVAETADVESRNLYDMEVGWRDLMRTVDPDYRLRSPSAGAVNNEPLSERQRRQEDSELEAGPHVNDSALPGAASAVSSSVATGTAMATVQHGQVASQDESVIMAVEDNDISGKPTGAQVTNIQTKDSQRPNREELDGEDAPAAKSMVDALWAEKAVVETELVDTKSELVDTKSQLDDSKTEIVHLKRQLLAANKTAGTADQMAEDAEFERDGFRVQVRISEDKHTDAMVEIRQLETVYAELLTSQPAKKIERPDATRFKLAAAERKIVELEATLERSDGQQSATVRENEYLLGLVKQLQADKRAASEHAMAILRL